MHNVSTHESRKKPLMLVAGIIFMLFLFYTSFRWFIYKPENIVKEAVTKSQIENKNFILAKQVATTGYSWEIVGSNNYDAKMEMCNIIGSPQQEISMDFYNANNTYVFYVEDVEYIDTIGVGIVTTYYVSDWTVLFPVKCGELQYFFDSKRYVTKKDMKQTNYM